MVPEEAREPAQSACLEGQFLRSWQVKQGKERKGRQVTMEITPEREQQIHKRLLEANPYPRMMGFEIDLLGKGFARLGVNVRNDLLQLQGIMHGGAIASLIDTAVAIAIASDSNAADRFTTVEMKINYLAPIRKGRVRADARLIRNGRRIIVAECDVYDSEDKLAAKGLLTYIRLSE
jgi:acyl-CoA thioesterase